MKTLRCVFALVMLSVIIADPAYSQTQSLRSWEFHPQVGEVIDADENALFNIFGKIDGFAAARLFAVGTASYRLHLLRHVADGGQVLIIQLNSVELNRLSEQLVKRIQNESIDRSQPIFPIQAKQWPQTQGLAKIYLHAGSMLMGTIRSVSHDTLMVVTTGGLTVPVPDVALANVEMVHAGVTGTGFYRSDPNTSRLFFAPTGRPLPQGQGYFADYWVFFPTLAVGLSDYFSLSGGMSIIPGAESQLLYFAPKITLPIQKNLGMSFGLLHLAIPEGTDDLTLGYGVFTSGTAASAFTLGAGLPLNSDTDRNLIILFGGETQVSNSAKLITENWLFNGDETTLIFSLGVRFFGDKMAVDLALVSTEEAFQSGGGFPFFPWVDFSIFWGK